MLVPHDSRLDPCVHRAAQTAACDYEVVLLGMKEERGTYRPDVHLPGCSIITAETQAKDWRFLERFRFLGGGPGEATTALLLAADVIVASAFRWYHQVRRAPKSIFRWTAKGFHRFCLQTETRLKERLSPVNRRFPLLKSVYIPVRRFGADLAWQTAAGMGLSTRSDGAPQRTSVQGRRTKAKGKIAVPHPKARDFVRYLISASATLIRAYARADVRPDIIHCNDIYSLPAGIQIKRMHGCPLLYDPHELWPEAFTGCRSWMKGFVKDCEKLLIKHVDEVVQVSPQLAAKMEKWYDLPWVKVVPNAAKLKPNPGGAGDPGPQMTAPTSDVRGTNRDNLLRHLAGSRIVFLYQGSYAPGRGLEELIAAWRQVDSQRALLVLRGPRWAYTDQLEHLAKDQVRNGDIFFLPAVDEEALISEARHADVGLIPYRAITLNMNYCCPNKLSQYMQAGLAIVCNDLEYVKSLVDLHECGLSYDSDDPGTLVEAVQRFIDDPEFLKQCKQRAFAAGHAQFHWDRTCVPLIEAYARLVNGWNADSHRGCAETQARRTGRFRFSVRIHGVEASEEADQETRDAHNLDPVAKWARSKLLLTGIGDSAKRERDTKRYLDEVGSALLERHRQAERVAYLPTELASLREAVTRDFPTSAEQTLERAEQAINKTFRVLGAGPYTFEGEIDWSSNLTGETWRKGYYQELRQDLYGNFFRNEHIIGDLKVTWDFNKHLHFFDLARAHVLSGSERYAKAFRSHLESWWRQNPYLYNLPWTEPLIVAQRAIAWILTMRFLIHSAAVEGAFYLRYLASLYDHLVFIRDHLPIGEKSCNHAFGSLAGILAIVSIYSEFDISAKIESDAWGLLDNEFHKQVYPDGVHYEQATSYQRYVLEFLLTVLCCRRFAGKAPPIDLSGRMQNMEEYLMNVMSPNGFVNLISDADGAYVYKFDTNHINNYRPHLALSGALLNRGDFFGQGRGCHEVLYWMLHPDFPRPAAASPGNLSRFFPSGGMVIMRSDWSPSAVHLTYDCGNIGLGYEDDATHATHGQDDTLSITVSAGGQQLLVDCGPGSYTWHRLLHDSLRSSMGHNVISLSPPALFQESAKTSSVQSHSVLGATWTLERRARPLGRGFARSELLDVAWASHDGYRRYVNQPLHQRIVVYFKPDVFVIIDRISGAKKAYHQFLYPLHFAPGIKLTQIDRGVIAHADGVNLLFKYASSLEGVAVDFHEGREYPLRGWFAEDYGVVVPSPTVDITGVMELPAEVAAMIHVGEEADPAATARS